ncbi:MAG TPA: hypothetical protein VJ801_07290 [Polyangia bacterium]|jgi:hypothetical protein|nr:hypothetical protein [Polyangia bacterium]
MRHLLRTRSLSRLRLIAALLFPLLLTAGVSCNAAPVGSNYIPIPPPSPTFGPPIAELDSAGVAHTYWKVTSPPSSGLSDLWVYLENIDLGAGASVRAAQDGSYTTRVEGQQDDRIVFGFGASDNEIRCWPLREGLADTPCQ